MKHITADVIPVPAMSEQDVKDFMEWVFRIRQINKFNPIVMSYPRTVMTVAKNEEENLLFIPLQAVLMFDSIAPKPGLSPRQEALCLWRIGQKVDEVMMTTGFRECIFFTSDDSVADICSQHGFTELKGVRILRKKAPPVETPSTETIVEGK